MSCTRSSRLCLNNVVVCLSELCPLAPQIFFETSAQFLVQNFTYIYANVKKCNHCSLNQIGLDTGPFSYRWGLISFCVFLRGAIKTSWQQSHSCLKGTSLPGEPAALQVVMNFPSFIYWMDILRFHKSTPGGRACARFRACCSLLWEILKPQQIAIVTPLVDSTVQDWLLSISATALHILSSLTLLVAWGIAIPWWRGIRLNYCIVSTIEFETAGNKFVCCLAWCEVFCFLPCSHPFTF
jgi:hypothetical protein